MNLQYKSAPKKCRCGTDFLPQHPRHDKCRVCFRKERMAAIQAEKQRTELVASETAVRDMLRTALKNDPLVNGEIMTLPAGAVLTSSSLGGRRRQYCVVFQGKSHTIHV